MTARILVVGGSGGIGSACCERLVHAGFGVTFTYGSSESEARALEARVRARDPQASINSLACDLRDPDAAHGIIAALTEEQGPFFGLIYCAGTAYDSLASMVKTARLEETFRINFISLVAITKALLRGMIVAKAGRIVAISSVAAHRGRRGNGVYAASKAAMEGYLRCLAEEVGSRGITVNWIQPGFIRTPMISDYRDLTALAERPSLRRLGTPDDVAALADFLMTEGAAYVHGTGLATDGGLSAGLGI